VISIALEMILPGLVGLWIDRSLGTVMVFLVLGLAVGMAVAMLHLIRWTKSIQSQGGRRSSVRHDDREQR
jgi:F0F1-type ATP synthase assembly protein I